MSAEAVPVLQGPTAQRIRIALRRAMPALAMYAAARMIGLLCLTAVAWGLGKHPRTLLAYSADSIWYAGIAQRGYGTSRPYLPYSVHIQDLAFFPLYPALVRAVTELLPVQTIDAGLLVAWISAGLAAWGIYAVGEQLHGRRAAVLLVVLWGLLPHAVVQSMAYTESLFTALASWSLYALLTRRPLWAGVLALAAGLTRPSGIAVVAAVIAAALLDARNRRAWAGAALAPIGWLGYISWVGFRTGKPLGYFQVQADWQSHVDFGYSMARITGHLLIRPEGFVLYVMLAIVAAALVSLVLLGLDRPPLPLLVFTVVLVALALGVSNYYTCKPRFLLPAFPLLMPAAVALAKARVRTVAVLLAPVAGFSVMYGPYLLAYLGAYP